MKEIVLVKRRARRGRPRLDEKQPKTEKINVYVARDPQGVKIFKKKPSHSIVGLWTGEFVPGFKAMEPRTFVMKFRNAVLPARGSVLRAKLET